MKKTILTLALSSCFAMGIVAAPVQIQAEEPAVYAEMAVAKVTFLTNPVSKNQTFQMEIEKGTWNQNTRIEINRISSKTGTDRYAYDFTTTPLKNGNLLVETNSWIQQDNGVLRVRVFGDYKETYIGWVNISGTVNTDQFFSSMTFPGMKGWKQDANGVWAWYSDGGRKETYWKDIDGKRYRFTGSLGNMVAGQWFTEGGKSYYLGTSGALAKNRWVDDNGDWYYVDANGNPKTGWLNDGGKWYYLVPTNDMYYYFKDEADSTGEWPYARQHPGKMRSAEWMTEGGKTYYFGKNGAMKTGWCEIGGKWYYFDGSGNMVRNTTIDGYKINSDGVWVQ